MSLRSKVLAIIGVIVAVYGVADYAAQHRIILPSFIQLERDEAEKDLLRCTEAVKREIQQLGASASDYGAWDDTAQFILDGNKQYVEDNISNSSMKNLGINWLCICSPQGEVMASSLLDLDTEEPLEIPDIPKESFSAEHILLQLKEPTDLVEGIVMTGQGPMLVASSPVLNNNREGPVRGAVIMGRLLNQALVAQLGEQTKVQFEVLPAVSSRPFNAALAGATVSGQELPVRIDDGQDGFLSVSTTLSDITGAPMLPVRATVPRDITAKGMVAMKFASWSIASIGFLVLVALLVSLQWTVLGPMSRLTGHVVRVGKTDDLTTRLSMDTGDEIGTLAREFDRMVQRLADARKELVDQSYESGIAEMASGTLHNVRNALTPVLVELDMLRQELGKAPIDQIDAAKKQLTGESVPESRRQDLARFLDLASGRLVDMTRETHAKLGDVAVRAKQIEQFLSDQENMSRADRPMEWVTVSDLVHEAAALLPAELRGRLSLEMGPGTSESGSLKTNRICLLQILGNLLTNAAEAIGEAGKPQGRMVIDTIEESVDGSPMFHLSVRDDGAGILPENLSRVFERGFTTKGRVSRGKGLHWCANSVAMMGGRIYAESEGAGRGACLHVLLPKVS